MKGAEVINTYIKEKTILPKITEVFICLIVVLFPLLVDSTGFFKILEFKYHTYLIISVGYLFTTIIVSLYYYLYKGINVFKNIKLSNIQIAAIIFLIINIVSCFSSPYFNKYNLFIGIGRGEGLITISLYTITFLFITLFGRFRKEYIYLFSISSILFSFIAILQFLGFNPFNIFQDGIGIHNVSFMGTIGNVNFISAYFCIVLTISVAAYIFIDDNSKFRILHIISLLMGWIIFQVINVNGGRVAFIGALVIFVPFIILSSKRFSRLLVIVSTLMFAYFLNLFVNPSYYWANGIIKLNWKINCFSLTFFVLSCIFLLLSYLLKKCSFNFVKKRNILIFYSIVLTLVLVVIVFIYIYDFTPDYKLIYEIHQMLRGDFDDNYGTYRVFLWKRAIKLIPDSPLIGTGPDTFTPRFMDKHAMDVIKINDGILSINDTAANVYLTMCVNIGLIGLLAYLSFLILLIIKIFKKYNMHSLAILTGIICYMIHDFVSLWVVIVTPIFWVTLALFYMSVINNDKREEEKIYGKKK